MFDQLCRARPARRTGRVSSWDITGGNEDFWHVQPGESRVLASIDGPGIITHVWSCFAAPWRDMILQVTWDDAPGPSIDVPFGDFFGLGHGLVNSYQSALFSTSTDYPNQFNTWCAHNCYVPMPFKKKATFVLKNESPGEVLTWFYIDHERVPLADVEDTCYFHAEFHRELPFGGWGHELPVNSPGVDGVTNVGKDAWDNNHVILDTRGCGHYIGCNVSVTNLRSTTFAGYGQPGYSWWGEGDDMIWVDGYKWPPDLHGTGSEDYFNHGMGMQRAAFMRNGSSLHEFETGGYQTSYVFHLENPVRFTRKIKVTMENGHANHLANEISSTAYWYATEPVHVRPPLPVEARRVIPREKGSWVLEPGKQHVTRHVPLDQHMMAAKNAHARSLLTPHETIMGVLIVPGDGAPFIKSRGGVLGPGITIDISLHEIVEEYLPAPVVLVSIDGDEWLGSMTLNAGGDLVVETRGSKPTTLGTLVLPLSGKRVKIVFGQLLDTERPPGIDAGHVFIISSNLNFRDD